MARLAGRRNPAPLQPAQARQAPLRAPSRQNLQPSYNQTLQPAVQHPIQSAPQHPLQAQQPSGAWGPGSAPVDNFPSGAGASTGGGFDAGTSATPLTVDTPVVTPPDPTADPTYQAELAELTKALADYQNQINVGNSQYDIGYNDNLRQLGWNADTKSLDPTNMAGFYGQALENNTNDYASRGMLTSGLFGESAADIGTDYNNRVDQYGDARQGFLNGQNAQMASYKGQDEAARAASLRNAIARLSAEQQAAV